MMVRREELRAERRTRPTKPPESLILGSLDQVRRRLPLVVDMGGRPFRVLELDGELVAHSTVCAHMLGPLDHAEVEAGCIRCPSHGYRYDVRTGRSCNGRGLELEEAP